VEEVSVVAETAFLTAVQSYLQGALQNPAPALIGVAEPETDAQLPAVVLSLESTERAGNGLGERSTLITDGALRWTVSIDLANPVLPEDPIVRLLDNARLNLILPHGGQVRQDASTGPLGPSDLSVNVAGTDITVVSSAPAPGQVIADPVVGQLTFGSALPATGIVTVTYFLGQWEQRVIRFKGVLRADACGADADAGTSVADAIVTALTSADAKTAITRLLRIELVALSSVGASEQPTGLRRRTARFSFDFESEDNHPDASGGVIARIPINVRLGIAAGNPATGTVSTTVVPVSG
jgi:hypothetical protein